jgi:hypothetical protein
MLMIPGSWISIPYLISNSDDSRLTDQHPLSDKQF